MVLAFAREFSLPITASARLRLTAKAISGQSKARLTAGRCARYALILNMDIRRHERPAVPRRHRCKKTTLVASSRSFRLVLRLMRALRTVISRPRGFAVAVTRSRFYVVARSQSLARLDHCLDVVDIPMLDQARACTFSLLPRGTPLSTWAYLL